MGWSRGWIVPWRQYCRSTLQSLADSGISVLWASETLPMSPRWGSQYFSCLEWTSTLLWRLECSLLVTLKDLTYQTITKSLCFLSHEHAMSSLKKVQKWYEKQYDKKASTVPLWCGDWALIHFPQDVSGKQMKLSRPWHVCPCPPPYQLGLLVWWHLQMPRYGTSVGWLSAAAGWYLDTVGMFMLCLLKLGALNYAN